MTRKDGDCRFTTSSILPVDDRGMAVVAFATHIDTRARKQPLSRLECFLHNAEVSSARNMHWIWLNGPFWPIDPSVVHRGLEYAVTQANKFGMKDTVVIADKALHDILYGLREQAFLTTTPASHCHDWAVWCRYKLYGRSWKQIRNCGAEIILIETGLCKQGTANKSFLQQGITTRLCSPSNYYGKQ